MTEFGVPTMVVLAVATWVVGFVCAIYALSRSRTPQGATAWAMALIGFPFVAIPLFVIFGRNKFIGYNKMRHKADAKIGAELRQAEKLFTEQTVTADGMEAMTNIARRALQPGFTKSNRIRLLVDGEQTYASMFEAIERAEKYVLFQFYVFRVDGIGRKFADLLIKKARAGVKVYFLYDDIGTKISREFVREMQSAGVAVTPFHSETGVHSRFQINFRNHRKIVVADGKVGFVGGINVGDDYLGLWPEIGYWRDTHLRLEGTSVAATQLSFVKDWYWATETIPDLDWLPYKGAAPVADDAKVMVLHTGPADREEACLHAHLALINSAQKQVWIANPYLVPPEGVVSALALAILRGVDVRLLLPSKSDSQLVMLASEVYIEKLLRMGAKIFKYTSGFLHQKVMLIDDKVAAVGSVNLDTRSLFINFEITAVSPDPEFIREVGQMLAADFEKAAHFTLDELGKRSELRCLLSRATNLLAPVL